MKVIESGYKINLCILCVIFSVKFLPVEIVAFGQCSAFEFHYLVQLCKQSFWRKFIRATWLKKHENKQEPSKVLLWHCCGAV